MRYWLTLITISIALAQASWAQLTIRWISQGANLSGQPADSRFPSISADGTQVVFQVGNGDTAQIWQSVFNTATNQWQSAPVTTPGTTTPLLGTHPVISTDGNHIAFASWQDYRAPNQPPFPKSQIYVLDRLQNRIVPISFLWRDNNGNDGMRDTFEPSNGNCIPVSISADGRIVVFLAQSPNALNIVDAEGDGVSDPVTNPPSGWLVIVHDRDADGNGVYDEAGIGATKTLVASYDWDTNVNGPVPISVGSVSVSANGRFIAYATPDANNPELWRVLVRDWQMGSNTPQNPIDIGILWQIDNALAPSLSYDGMYLAYLKSQEEDDDNDGQVNEDPIDNTDNDNDTQIDEDPPEILVVRQLIDPATKQPLTQTREVRLGYLLSGLTIGQRLDGSAGWGYSDWWGAVTIAVDPTNANRVYVAFHAWATELIDLQNNLLRNNDGDGQVDEDPINGLDDDGDGRVDEDPPVNFYQGVPNIFLAQFDFGNDSVQLWQLLPPSASPTPAWSPRALPVSLERNGTVFRLPLAPSLLPVVSFVNGNRLAIAFQSLVVFDANDTNGLWDIYLADVLLP